MKKNKALMVSVVEAPAAAAATDDSVAAAVVPVQLPLVGVTPLVPDGASVLPSTAAEEITDRELAVLLDNSLRSGLYATAEQFDAATAYTQAPDSVQQQLAVLMRAETTGIYLFTPAGDRYHLQGACHVSQNDRVIEMAPCEFCVIEPMAIYEGCVLQTWYANTLMFREQRHYHADRQCRALGPTVLHDKTMCRICAASQQKAMVRYRLLIEQSRSR
jgi:hypothetical protein